MTRWKQTGPVTEWAKASRKAAGFVSAEEAAKAAGVPATWLRGVEAGQIRRPNAERVSLLERAYGSPAPVVPDDAPEEERLAELLVEAYERGLREGLRIARDG